MVTLAQADDYLGADASELWKLLWKLLVKYYVLAYHVVAGPRMSSEGMLADLKKGRGSQAIEAEEWLRRQTEGLQE